MHRQLVHVSISIEMTEMMHIQPQEVRSNPVFDLEIAQIFKPYFMFTHLRKHLQVILNDYSNNGVYKLMYYIYIYIYIMCNTYLAD